MLLIFILIGAAIILFLEAKLAKTSLAGIQEDHRPDEKLVDPDEVFYLELSLKNTGNQYKMFLKIEEQLPPEFVPLHLNRHVRRVMGGGHIISYTTWLRPHQEVQFRVPVSISRRGQYMLGTLRVFGGDFLGLKQEVRRLKQFRAVIAAPREAPESQITDVLGGFLGDISVRRFIYEDPVLTSGFREYTGREPMRSISWTQSARGQGLMVKKYDYTAEPAVSVLLNVDSTAADREALLEKCFSITRTVCRMLEEAGISYDFLTNADIMGTSELLGEGEEWSELGDGFGENHFRAVLERLGLATYYTPFSGERLLERSLEAGTSRGRILITPGDDFTSSQTLVRLSEAANGNLLILRAEEADTW